MSRISRLLGDWEARISRHDGVPSADRFETRRRPCASLLPLLLIFSTDLDAKLVGGGFEVLCIAPVPHPWTNDRRVGIEEIRRKVVAVLDAARNSDEKVLRAM